MNRKRTILFRVAAGILVVTALMKLPLVLGEGPGFGREDPVIGFLSVRQVLFVAVGTELAACWILLGRRSDLLKGGLLAWLASLFILYRLGLATSGVKASCNCLGLLVGWIPLSATAAEWLSRGLLLYLGGLGLMVLSTELPRNDRCPGGRFWLSAPWTRAARRHGVILAIALLSDAGCPAAEFEVSGVISESYPGGSPFAGQEKSYSFTVTVDDPRWHIRLLPKHWGRLEEKETIPDYLMACSDGHFFYSVTSIESSAAKVTPGLKANRALALRGPGAVPYKINDSLLVLWYMFGSHSYLQARTNKLVVPMAGGMPASFFQKGDFQFEGEWQLAAGPPGLPAKLHMFRGGHPTTHDGFLSAAHLEVIAATNVAGLHLPVLASASYLAKLPGRSASEAWKSFRAEVESVRASSSVSNYVPMLPDNSSVQEIRFWSNRPAINITARTNRWPDDTYLAAVFEAKKRILAPNSATLFIRVVLLAVAVIAPLALLVRLYRKSSIQHPNKSKNPS